VSVYVSRYVSRHSGPGLAEVERDARQRAWRTFWQSFLVDVGASVVAVLLPLVSDLEWTREWWLAAGALAAKTLVMAVVSYVARRLVPPA
jgi:uncharacterized membrane protein YcjF (UPF0283 family)